MKKRFFIYKAVCSQGSILYIGQSTNIELRMSQHRSSSEWWTKAKEVLVSELPSKTSMDIYELYYINKYTPPFNVSNNRGDDISLLRMKDLTFSETYQEVIARCCPKSNSKRTPKKRLTKEQKIVIFQEEFDSYYSHVKEVFDEIKKLTTTHAFEIDDNILTIYDYDGFAHIIFKAIKQPPSCAFNVLSSVENNRVSHFYFGRFLDLDVIEMDKEKRSDQLTLPSLNEYVDQLFDDIKRCYFDQQ